MPNIDNEFEMVGELTEDCQFIGLTHWKMLRRQLQKFVGKELSIKLSPVTYKRSSAQNRYLWGIVLKFIRHWFLETQGIDYKPDYLYSWVRIELLSEEPTIIEICGKEVIVMSGKRFSQMSTKEFATATDTIINKMAERGCIIPEPKKYNFIHEFILDE